MTAADTGSGKHSDGVKPEADSADLLLSAVKDLTRVVEILQNTLHDDYPKRAEIEHVFATKDQGRRARKQFAAIVLAAIIASSFVTLGSVSYCFLQGKQYGPCRVIPGYSATVTRSLKVAKQRDDATKAAAHQAVLLKQQEARIRKLEIKLAALG